MPMVTEWCASEDPLSLADRFFATAEWSRRRQLMVATIVVIATAVAVRSATPGKGERSPGAGLVSTVPASPSTSTTVMTTASIAASTTASVAPTSGPATTTGTAAATIVAESTMPASTSTTTVAPVVLSGEVLTLDMLAVVPVALEQPANYDRALFKVWSDLDGDGCDTRQEVLAEESRTPAQIDPFGCVVVAGDWVSIYDGLQTADPGALDVDHVVALKEAWDSGAWTWSATRRQSFANDLSDPRTLVAVSATSNRSKGDRDPSNWLPTESELCSYVSDWVSIKYRWSLTMDESEWGRIGNLLKGPCLGWTTLVAIPTG
jgi:hypothetical protein